MVDLTKHFLITKQFLKDFENLQKKMLHLRLDESIHPMKIRLSEYLAHIRPIGEAFAYVNNGHAYFLIKKRIELLIMHVNLITPLLDITKANEKDLFDIIVLFDKQHIFKKVIIAHLKDIDAQLSP